MKAKLGVALTAVFLGLLAVTAPAGAAKGPDFNTVLFGTAIVALSLMALLFVVYGIKVMAGIEKDLPPPETDTHSAHH